MDQIFHDGKIHLENYEMRNNLEVTSKKIEELFPFFYFSFPGPPLKSENFLKKINCEHVNIERYYVIENVNFYEYCVINDFCKTFQFLLKINDDKKKSSKDNNPYFLISSNGQSLIHLAVQFLSVNCFKVLLKKYPKTISMTDLAGRSILHLALLNYFLPMKPQIQDAQNK